MTGLEEGAALPPPHQVDPGAPCNAAITKQLQQLPSTLDGALQALQRDEKLQVGQAAMTLPWALLSRPYIVAFCH